MSSSNVDVYSVGLVSLSACVPKSMSKSEIIEEVNRLHPTGVKSRWTISVMKVFKGGEPMPCECEHDPNKQHWLLHC